MAQQWDAAVKKVSDYYVNNIDKFAGVDKRNIIAHLGAINAPLWHELNSAYESDIGGRNGDRNSLGIKKDNSPLNEWAFNNTPFVDQLAATGTKIQPPSPPPPLPQPPTPPQTNALDDILSNQNLNLQGRLDDIFGQVKQSGINNINEQFIPARQKAIAEEAALGRLTSPVSIVPLSKLDQQKNLAMANLFGNIASQRASGEFDAAKTIAGLTQAQSEAESRANQFGQDLNLRKQTLDEQARQFNLDNALKSQLGLAGIEAQKYSADKSKSRDVLDYILGSADVYSKIKPQKVSYSMV